MASSGKFAGTSGQQTDNILNNTKMFEQKYKSNQLRANLMALTTALYDISVRLNNMGLTLVVGWINNEGSHVDNFGSKSHMYNDKADVYLIKNDTGKRVTAREWIDNAQLRTNVLNVFNAHGLHAQGETDSLSANNLWLDTWIWQGYVKSGADLTGYGNRSWGTYVIYDVSRKKGM